MFFQSENRRQSRTRITRHMMGSRHIIAVIKPNPKQLDDKNEEHMSTIVTRYRKQYPWLRIFDGKYFCTQCMSFLKTSECSTLDGLILTRKIYYHISVSTDYVIFYSTPVYSGARL